MTNASTPHQPSRICATTRCGNSVQELAGMLGIGGCAFGSGWRST